MLIFSIGSFFDLLYLNTLNPSQWLNLSVSEGILLNIVLNPMFYWCYNNIEHNVNILLYIVVITDIENASALHLIVFTDSFYSPCSALTLSPSPSSAGELATLTQDCLRGGRTNTIKREGANAKVEFLKRQEG